ncbi:MAG TPA: phage holin family protein [Mycobacteriales bacterium]|jgi:uncharacterized membrane protein|nr:phage holin family protein [Mycobacteriales bacterium]
MSERIDLDAPPGQRGVGELIGEIASDLSALVRQEIALAKAEVKQEAGKAGGAAGMFGGAGVAGLLVAIFGTLTLMFALDALMPIGWAALIVTVLWAVTGLVLYTRGRDKLRSVKAPQQTIETLKEDARWASHPSS